MADVILDPTTRAPSSALAKLLRLLAAVMVAKAALWLSGYGVVLDATDQIALVTLFAAVCGAIGTEARDRGIPVLRLLFALPLILTLTSCAWLGLGEPTPAKAWSVALTSYESAARGMAAWCAQPEAKPEPCIAAANATKSADLVVLSTEAKLKTGSIQDAELAVATSTLKMVLPLFTHGGN